MERKTKIILIASSIVMVGVIAVVLIYFKRKRDEREAAEQKADEVKAKTDEQKKIEAEYYLPKFNRNGELINPIAELRKVKIIAKKDGVNLRTTARINNDAGWFDFSSNILKTVKKGTEIGTLISETKGEETPQMRWFKFKLPTKDISGFEYVYVRADVVTFNKTKK